ncbi:MAG: hypothetical protein QM496_21775 [Verrucomicrobiota bacterium]
MILDVIIGLFMSLFSVLTEGVPLVVVPVANLFIVLLNLVFGGVELVLGLFIEGFSMGRIEKKQRKPKSPAFAVGGFVALLLIVGMLAWVLYAPKVLNQNITLLAEDGHGLPFAALIIHTKDGDRHERTDNAGNIEVSRFGTSAITVKDPRYAVRTWKKSEIESELVVGRTILGAGLDSLADKLLKAAKK